MFKLYTFIHMLMMVSCSSGEKNSPSITDAVMTRPYAPNVATPSVTPSTNDLTWVNQDTVLGMTTGTPLNETHNATDSNGSLLIYSMDLASSSCDEELWNPPLSIDGATGALSGTLLQASSSTCELVLKASSGLEEISKTISYAITSQTLIDQITAITLVNPLSSPSSETMPTFELSTVTLGDTVSLYQDAACSSPIESISVAADPQAVTLSNPLSDGSYDFYAMAVNATNSSLCSSVSINYTVDTTTPDAATLLVYNKVTALASASPLLSWTASATAGSTYKVSLGTAPGLKDVLSDEDVLSATSFTASGLSLSECSPVYPSIHTQAASGVQAPDLVDSNFFYYDITPPADPSGLTFLDYYLAGNGPTLSWTAPSDNCGAAVTYLVALGNSAGDDSIVNWTGVSSVSHAFSGLSLTPGTIVYMSVKAVDEGGLESNPVSASFIVPSAPGTLSWDPTQ